jgi:hypothetical protein
VGGLTDAEELVEESAEDSVELGWETGGEE